LKHEILVKDKERTKPCGENKHLMDGLYVYEGLVPKGCHNGACGVCKIKVHSGEFEKSKMNRKHISQEEEDSNIILACKTFPRSEMEIEFIGKKSEKKKKQAYTFGS
jgi:ferredoxin